MNIDSITVCEFIYHIGCCFFFSSYLVCVLSLIVAVGIDDQACFISIIYKLRTNVAKRLFKRTLVRCALEMFKYIGKK